MAKEENFDAQTNSTIRQWTKFKEDGERNYEAGRQGLHTFFEKALQNEIVRKKIEEDLRGIRKSGNRLNVFDESGYNMNKDDYDPLVDGGDYDFKGNE